MRTMKRPALLISSMIASLLVAAMPGVAVTPPRTEAPALAPEVIAKLDSLAATEEIDLIVTHERLSDRSILSASGISTITALKVLPITYARGTAAEWRSLASTGAVDAIELNERIYYSMATARLATRVEEVGSGAVSFNGSPLPLDGSGVGVAVIDSGIDATHPDLINRTVPGRNLRNVPGTTLYANVPDSDEHIGHGTHVAGIIAGDGTASNGAVRGVAPGSSLYGYGQGAVAFILNPLLAMDHILANRSAPGHPEIKVVNNSYGGVGEPTASSTVAIRALVNAGITVVFAAGNDGDDGLEVDNTNHYCKVKDPTGQPLKGLICVANYSEGEIGTSEGGLDFSSSRGPKSKPNNWPDVAAPGSEIEATRAKSGAVVTTPAFATRYGTTRLPYYITISGTSMAAPHTAGVAALMYQAAAAKGVSLTPAQVESTLKGTTHKFGNYAPFPNRHAGEGLVDARAAVESVLGLATSSMTPSLQKFNNSFAGLVFTGAGVSAGGQGTNVNAGAGGSAANDLTELEGFGRPLPDTNVITPGALSASAGLIPTDCGGSSLISPQPGMKVHATITYLATNNQVFSGFINLNAAGTRYQAPSFPYAYGVDGDIKADFTVDLDGDGTVDPFSDSAVSVVYRDAF